MSKIELPSTGYEIKKAEIINIKQLTNMEKLFRIRLKDGEALGHEPGQFVQVSVFGAGEAPISICSSPCQDDYFEICVRAAGRVTNRFHHLKIGDELGIRGPFGVGFPTEVMAGHDVMMVAGGLGLAPLRSLIHYIIDNRRDFGTFNILLGCKSPDSMLFGQEIKDWEKRADINFACTVDRSAPDWAGNVGLITALIPGVDIDVRVTYAACAGPPIMYRFVIEELLKKGLSDQNIYLTLERHMKCGVGHCGHCQIAGKYCCKDGPVFRYDAVKNLEGAL